METHFQPSDAPQMIEYKIGGVLWRCEKFSELVPEFEGLSESTMPDFHQMIEPATRQFQIVRRLFGIQPIEPPADFNGDDFRIWKREELVSALGITLPKLREELDAVRGAFKAVLRRTKNSPSAPASAKASEPSGKSSKKEGEFDFRQSDILKRFNFAIKFQTIEEGEMFEKIVQGFERVLNEPMVSGLGRDVLMTRLTIDRIRLKLNDPDKYEKNEKGFREDTDLAERLQKNYQEGITKILELCPWASQIAGKHALQPVISTITAAYLEYKKRDDRRLVDGVFSALGIRVECRFSKQMPTPRYRAGLVVAINAAKEGVLDPGYVCPFPKKELAKLDMAFRETYKAACVEAGDIVVDLQSDGADGEYPDLVEEKNEGRKI